MHNGAALAHRLQLVAFAVQFLPQHVLELLNALPRYGTDEAHGEVVGQFGPEHVNEFVVKEVAFRHSQYAVLVEHAGVELFQFAQQDAVFLGNMVGVAGHHEEEKGVTLNVAQKAQSQPAPLGCALDDAGNVGHHKRLTLAIGHYAQAGLHGGKGIVGYLGTGRRQGRHQRRLAGIGKAHKAYVRQQFQFQYHHHLLHRLARLGIARCLIGGGAKLPVAQSATSSLEQHDHLAVAFHVAQVLARFSIVGHGARRHINVAVLAVASVRAAFRTVTAMPGEHVFLIPQMQQRPVIVVAAQIHIATSATIAAIGSTIGLVFGPVQVYGATPALSGAAKYFHIVYEIGFWHNQVVEIGPAQGSR